MAVAVRRIRDMYNALLLLLYTAVPYNLLVWLVKRLRAGAFLRRLEPKIQRVLAIVIGSCLSTAYHHVWCGAAVLWQA